MNGGRDEKARGNLPCWPRGQQDPGGGENKPLRQRTSGVTSLLGQRGEEDPRGPTLRNEVRLTENCNYTGPPL